MVFIRRIVRAQNDVNQHHKMNKTLIYNFAETVKNLGNFEGHWSYARSCILAYGKHRFHEIQLRSVFASVLPTFWQNRMSGSTILPFTSLYIREHAVWVKSTTHHHDVSYSEITQSIR